MPRRRARFESFSSLLTILAIGCANPQGSSLARSPAHEAPAEAGEIPPRRAAPVQEAPPQRRLIATTLDAASQQPALIPKPPAAAESMDSPRSSPLAPGLFHPMPGGICAGYRADTGLDLAGFRMPVHALAAGTLDYSEAGHTRWNGRGDSRGAVRLALDEPIPYGERRITHVWYAHLAELRFHQAEGADERIQVEGGELLGVSGIANGSPHLHLGLLLDGEVDQRWGSYLLEDEVRAVLGGCRTGERLSP